MIGFQFKLSLVLLCVFVISIPHSGQSQNFLGVDSTAQVSAIVGKIVVIGNEKTKDYIILREIRTKIGEPLNAKVVEGDRKRILNLGLFSRVDMKALPVDDQEVVLVITVYESWYLYPFPIFFVNDRDWDKLSYGAGLLHYNFRGRRESVSFSGWGGYNPAVRLDYGNPWLFGNAQLFGSVGFFWQRVQNRSFALIKQDVDERRLGGNFTIGKRFGHFTYLSVQAGYSLLEFDPPVPGETLQPSGRDDLPTLGLSFLYDERDFYEYPRSGKLARLWMRKTGFRQEYIGYYRFGADLRYYWRFFRGLSLAMRGMTDLSHDNIPVYDRVYLGFSHRVRGHFYNRREGENLALGSAELRFPILPIRYYHADEMPIVRNLVPEYLTRHGRNLKFGISAGLFFDYGLVWFQKDELDRQHARFGFGGGIHFHVPSLKLVRVEAAVNEDGNAEGFVDVGVSF